MSLPIDEGAPAFTARSGFFNNDFDGSNFATALRLHILDQASPASGQGEVDLTVFFALNNLIHDRTQVSATELGTAMQVGNLHVLNPIGYQSRPITNVLQDFLFHQAHLCHGRMILDVVGDKGTNQWTRSTGAGTHASHVDEDVTAPSITDYLESTTAAQIEQLILESLPSGALDCNELIVVMWVALRAGTDRGMAMQLTLKNPAAATIGRAMIADTYFDDVIRQAQIKFEGTEASSFTGYYLEIETKRGSAGGTPNPRWRLYAIQAIAYYELDVFDPLCLDVESITDLDSQFAAHVLSFDVLEGTYRSAFMDILAHAPELFFYSDYLGRFHAGRIGAYADVATPRELSTLDGSIEAVTRGPYRYTERTANAIAVLWDVDIPHTSSGAAEKNPVNRAADRGSRRLEKASSWVVRKGSPDWKELDRHFIRTTVVADKLADTYLEL